LDEVWGVFLGWVLAVLGGFVPGCFNPDYFRQSDWALFDTVLDCDGSCTWKFIVWLRASHSLLIAIVTVDIQQVYFQNF